MIRIAVDAMGSDEYPVPDIVGAVMAAKEFKVEIFLVGDEKLIKPVLAAQEPGNLPIRIIHAPDMLSMEDKGEKLALKTRHKDSKTSMAVGIRMVKNNEADAFVTAGNTGGAWLTSLFNLGRIRGVDRPGLAPIFPTATGSCVVIDTGANPDCKPEHLMQFAILGSTFVNKARGVINPRVALLSNGEEGGKGNELVRNTYPLLAESGLNFIGNVEGKELFGGAADVVVTDGFASNILLKSSEAVAKLITDTLKEQLKSSPISMVGAMLAKPAFKHLKAMMDPDDVGAAPLLGINGLVFIGHGRSNARALVSAVRAARQAVTANTLQAIHASIRESISHVHP